MQPEPFEIAISEERLKEMRRRLRNTAWPGDFGNEDWRFGVREDWLREMVAYWADGYDWRAEERRMNTLPHFRVEIDGVPIHFIHLRSGRPGAIPLILTHGWPWSFWDWQGIIAELTREDSAPAFDLVVPSLPGYGFSSPLRKPGVNMRAIGDIWVRLMCDVLGYERFAAAGGDWGSAITAELGHAHSKRLLAIHLTLVLLPDISGFTLAAEDFAPDEQWMHRRMGEAFPHVTSHVAVHSADPQTLAYAMADSPVGTAAWLWERRRAWSDCDGDVLSCQSRDALCTLASLYWLTNTTGTSFRLYAEQFTGQGFSQDWPLLHDRQPMIPVPTGVAVAPKEVAFLPRAEVAKRVDLRRWQVVPRGGHFLPAEQPATLASEYRAFFGEVLGGGL
jgi:pimeloyl-ACP methyl ester carboxylesterase